MTKNRNWLWLPVSMFCLTTAACDKKEGEGKTSIDGLIPLSDGDTTEDDDSGVESDAGKGSEWEHNPFPIGEIDFVSADGV